MLYKSLIKRKSVKFKTSIFKLKKNMFIKNCSITPQKDVKGRFVSRYRKNKVINKFFKVNEKESNTDITLVKYIFFSKNSLKFYNFNKSAKGMTFLSQTVNNLRLFSYNWNKKSVWLKHFPFLKNDIYLFYIKSGSIVSNLELSFNKGRQYIKSAGCKGLVITKTIFNKKMLVKLPSKEVKFFSIYSMCSEGPIYFKDKESYKKNNVRLKRLRGFRSIVRGIAMNPIDHPHGGKKKSVRFPRNPWGKAAKLK